MPFLAWAQLKLDILVGHVQRWQMSNVYQQQTNGTKHHVRKCLWYKNLHLPSCNAFCQSSSHYSRKSFGRLWMYYCISAVVVTALSIKKINQTQGNMLSYIAEKGKEKATRKQSWVWEKRKGRLLTKTVLWNTLINAFCTDLHFTGLLGWGLTYINRVWEFSILLFGWNNDSGC